MQKSLPWFKKRCLVFLSWMIHKYIILVFKTTRWKGEGKEIFESYWKQKKPFIVCFWHNRLLMQSYLWDKSPLKFNMLISSHQDGQLIAETIGRLGIDTIYGSTSHGGTEALREMIAAAKKGECIGITPDGPRGPRFKASKGIAHVAYLTGLDVVPCAYATSYRKVWKSWDRFILAFPFGRGAMVIGAPLSCPRTKEEIDPLRQKIEDALQDVCRRADAVCGYELLT